MNIDPKERAAYWAKVEAEEKALLPRWSSKAAVTNAPGSYGRATQWHKQTVELAHAWAVRAAQQTSSAIAA